MSSTDSVLLTQPLQKTSTPLATVRRRPDAQAATPGSTSRSRGRTGVSVEVNSRPIDTWLRTQDVNTRRHSGGLGPFPLDSFGDRPPSPTRAHVAAVNEFLGSMQSDLHNASSRVRLSSGTLRSQASLGAFLARRAQLARLVATTEKVWDFYYDVFSQRTTALGPMLLAADRIALDCYQTVFTNLAEPRSIPAPAPFSYMHGERGAATFRRGVPVSLLGHRANPFPLVKLPLRRLMNPWTLGAVPHEVAHNLQADLGLWTTVPARIEAAMRRRGIPESSRATWKRWHKEVFADLLGVLLMGPNYVTSLTEVVARPRVSVLAWNPTGVHPTPYLRPLISIHLLVRLNQQNEARWHRLLWKDLYPRVDTGTLPRDFEHSFRIAAEIAVDTICFTPYEELGGRSLAQVVRFADVENSITDEAAQRLAQGNDPGVIPERMLIGAARRALQRGYAPADVITRSFYDTLNGR